MRNKLISFIILVLALSLLVIGIIEVQFSLIGPFYEDMSELKPFGS